jgi:hypothetical protein
MAKKKTNVATATESCGANIGQLPFRNSGPGLSFRAPKPKSRVGAAKAGRAAALSYLKHLRSGDSHDGETFLTTLVEAIHYGSNGRKASERSMLAFGFLHTLDAWLRLAAEELGSSLDDLSGEELGAQISGGLAMTEDQSTRDWRSSVARSGWETRRQAAKRTAEVANV